MKLGKWILQIWPLLPAAIYLLSFFIIVFSSLLFLSFTTVDSFAFTFEPLVAVFSMEDFHSALLNTLIFVLIGTPLELAIGLFLALLVYNSFVMKSFVRSFFVVPIAIPGLVVATLLFILFDTQGGFINHVLMGKYLFFPKLINASIDWRGTKIFSFGLSLFGKVWRDMPISMLILLSGLNTIDKQMFDAAKTMGAGMRLRLIKIVIPLILPSISAVVILRSIEMWKEFIFPYVLAGRYNLLGTLIESLYIDRWGQFESEAALVALLLVVFIIISGILFIRIIDLIRYFLTDELR